MGLMQHTQRFALVRPQTTREDHPERGSWTTIKPNPKRGRSFAARLTFAFALTACMVALILAIVLAMVWESQFRTYTRRNMQASAASVASSLAEGYRTTGTLSFEHAAASVSTLPFSSDLRVQVRDAQGAIIYDDSWEKHPHTAPSSAHLTSDNAVPPVPLEHQVQAPILLQSGRQVGTVHLWAPGSDALLTKADLSFKASSYTAIVASALCATICACIVGFVMSRSLTKPIQKITSTAKQLRNGDLTARTGVLGNDEIGRLGETFDDMASTIERDLKLEHRLTGDVAHELRTPLMAIQATVEAMQDGVLPADSEHLEVVASEVRRLSRLIDVMLRLSRLENGTIDLNYETADVVLLIRTLVASQQQLFHEKGLHLHFVDDTVHGELIVEMDPDLLREAVVNLLSNAMRYTDPDGWVKVSVRHDKTDCMISVQDTGIGIAKEDISQTFARFWRSDVSRTRVSGGLGVGLSITKEIIDKHNGSILVESELGKGTTFTLRIPQHHDRKRGSDHKAFDRMG